MIKFLQLPGDEQRKIYQDVSNKLGVPPQAVEKDVWVTLMLKMVFSSELAPYSIFKGGTSLSKAYDLIKRFSEDIDIGIDREYLGFEGDLSKGKIRKLRRACHTFVSRDLMELVRKQLNTNGVDENWYELIVENTQISDQDPETILVNYKSLYDQDDIPYLQPKVKIEVSARSLIEPYQRIEIQSWVDEQYTGTAFTEGTFPVNATDPQKTFLEKLILLHEEFQKPKEKVRHFRMSRHFYDIGQILKTAHGQTALKNHELFKSIITHRKVLTPLKTTDYETLTLKSINIVPPREKLGNFITDYKEMTGSMIQEESGSFEELLNEILKQLK